MTRPWTPAEVAAAERERFRLFGGHVPYGFADVGDYHMWLALPLLSPAELQLARKLGALALAGLIALAAFGASAQRAASATITRHDAAPIGAAWAAATISAERSGACSIGGASIGCAPIPADPLPPLVRYGQDLPGGWNSQDTDSLAVTFSAAEAFDSRWIQTRDAHDQARSRWVMELEGATAELLERQDNGARNGWLVRLGRAVTSVTTSFSTRLADGFSLRGKVCRR